MSSYTGCPKCWNPTGRLQCAELRGEIVALAADTTTCGCRAPPAPVAATRFPRWKISRSSVAGLRGRCRPAERRSARATRWWNCSPRCWLRRLPGNMAPSMMLAGRSGFGLGAGGTGLYRSGYHPAAGRLTLPLLWLGLLFNLLGIFTTLQSRSSAPWLATWSVAGLLGVQAGYRQGGHGIWRFQAVGRHRRLAGLGAAAGHHLLSSVVGARPVWR